MLGQCFWEDNMHHRHDISDSLWNFLESHLPGRDGAIGRKAEDNRRFINAVFWILRTGATADCAKAADLATGSAAEYLLADKGYDSDEIVEFAKKSGMIPVIPPRKNRKVRRDYDKYPYKIRRLVESAFLKMKQWRGIATRYAKMPRLSELQYKYAALCSGVD
jgi:transposase